MGTTVELVVPEEEQRREVIENYYKHVQKKSAETKPDWPAEAHESTGNPEFTVNLWDSEGEFYIFERFLKPAIEATDWERVRGLFEFDETWHERVLTDPEDIEELIEILRDAEKELQQTKPDRNLTHALETGIVALCEFAAENGYGVEIHLG